jgi:REP element-mobilizing transposase RayT
VKSGKLIEIPEATKLVKQLKKFKKSMFSKILVQKQNLQRSVKHNLNTNTYYLVSYLPAISENLKL